VSKRRAEIFVHGKRVFDPVILDWDAIPADLSVGVSCTRPNIHAEFDRIEIRELASSPATNAGDSPLETREPATKESRHRATKLGKGESSHNVKPFDGTLRVTNPVRQSRASSRKRVLRGDG
jgi:hypothetical protein